MENIGSEETNILLSSVEAQELVNILNVLYSDVKYMAGDLSEGEYDCYYCAHYSEGGDGKCILHRKGFCNFRWRHADKVEQALVKLTKNHESEDIN